MKIAIVGFDGRFPDCNSVPEMWRALTTGRSCLRRFSPDELRAAGLDEAEVARPDRVPVGGVVAGAEDFDAELFGLAPAEAATIDPQQRIFLECVLGALEGAGHPPASFDGRIGLFGGVGVSGWLWRASGGGEAGSGAFQAFLGSDKDFAATRAAYLLNLRGPAVTVQTACSTSLVAVHLACQSLALGECDMALAGGASIRLPQTAGYLYERDGIESPDGACRPFDEAAAGTVFGNGAAVVALRRLDEAVADGDTVYAVIEGSGINNDGSDKVGFTAPGVNGQATAIAEALAVAGADPDRMAFIEAHGTGTRLGDAIELRALSRAFARRTSRKGFCALGSVKANFGHLDTAAGVAGLIKAALALYHRLLPAAPGIRNPAADLADSPFFLPQTPLPLGPGRLWAGVSSFGVGGTNAHVVLRSADAPVRPAAARKAQLVVLSGRSPAARDMAAGQLARALAADPALDLADVSHTLLAGRTARPFRAATAAEDGAALAAALTDPGSLLQGSRTDGEPPRLGLLFSGQGSQHAGMALGLYDTEPAFAAAFDRAREVLRPILGLDLLELLRDPDGDARLEQTAIAQPAIVAVGWSMAETLRSWGLQPAIMLGHSLGEYTATCVAGVFEPEEALRLVALRGRLMQALPAGRMLAVDMAEQRLAALLPAELSIAAVNGPTATVLSGAPEAVERFAERLGRDGVACAPLRTSHAFHSAMMEPMMERFAVELARVRPMPPRLPVISNLSGRILTAAEATDPAYWCRHLREPVRFADGVSAFLAAGPSAVAEVGPGQTLAALAKRHPDWPAARPPVPLMRHRHDPQSDSLMLMRAAARLWTAGFDLDPAGLHPVRRRRVALPGTPFLRRRLTLPPPAAPKAEAGRTADAELSVPAWLPCRPRPASPPPPDTSPLTSPGAWFLRTGSLALAERAAAVARDAGILLLSDLDPPPGLPLTILIAAGLSQTDPGAADALAALLRELSGLPERPVRLVLVVPGLLAVTGDEPLDESRGALLGLFRSAVQELPQLSALCLDPGDPDPGPEAATRLAALAGDASATGLRAWRGGVEWQPVSALLPSAPPPPVPPALPAEPEAGGPAAGAWLITGGLGSLGVEAAQAIVELAAGGRVELYLLARSPVPPVADWPAAIAGGHVPAALARRMQRLLALGGPQVGLHVHQGDVADEAVCAALLRELAERHGQLAGIIHAAGRVDAGVFAPVGEGDAERRGANDRAKLRGLESLARGLEGIPCGVVVAYSSLATLLGGIGYGHYAGANARMEAMCRRLDRAGGPTRWIAAAWDAWDAWGSGDGTGAASGGTPDIAGLSPAAGRAALRRILAEAHRLPAPVVHVSAGPLAPRIRSWEEACAGCSQPPAGLAASLPPPTRQAADGDALGALWRSLLGVEDAQDDDGFFALGGTSLTAIQLINRLGRETGIELSLADVVAAQTLGALRRLAAGRVRSAGGGAPLIAGMADREGAPPPATDAQRLLWLIEQEEPGASHIAEAYRLRGPLDADALERALAALVARHDALRTGFRMDADGLRLAVRAPAEVRTTLRRIRIDADGDAETAIRRIAEAEFRAPFDLADGPMIRLLLLSVAGPSTPPPSMTDGGHVLLVTLHHIAADDWSVGLLFSELEALYRQHAGEPVPPLPPPALRFADYAAWIAGPERAAAWSESLSWWTERLAAPPAPPLPPDLTGPRGFAGAAVRFELGAGRTGAVAALAERLSATSYMVLLAVFTAALHAVGGRETVAVGTPLAGRDDPELEGLVGYLVNPVLLTVACGGAADFAALTARVREQVEAVRRHGDLPHGRLVAELRRNGTLPPRGRLIGTWMTLLTHGGTRSLGGDLVLHPEPLAPTPARFDLALILEPGADGLAGRLEYALDVYAPATAGRVAHAFTTVLDAVVADPGLPLATLVERVRASRPDGRRAEGGARPQGFAGLRRAAPAVR